MKNYRVNRPEFNSYWDVQVEQADGTWKDVSTGFERFVYADMFRLGLLAADWSEYNEGRDDEPCVEGGFQC